LKGRIWSNVADWQRREHQSPITERAIRKAADAGHVDAMHHLGNLLSIRPAQLMRHHRRKRPSRPARRKHAE
jgi:hypothetical protein